MKLDLVQYPNDVLTTPCAEITEITDEIRELARSMGKVMHENKGIGLAAPQVGFGIRMCIIDPSNTLGDHISSPIVMINPVITQLKRPIELHEGCLSHGEEQYRTKRYQMCNVKYTKLDGRGILVPAKGLFAICIQHEVDHLEGSTIKTKFSPAKKNE